ncbi:hypothetical protein GCM10007105_27750 [Shewanella chilikensis]|nr:hypothetical protein GCM10007105_27750 [Shewanella chilikensis]
MSEPALVQNLEEARYEIKLWREHYNRVRPHSSLNYIPPVAVFNELRKVT